MGLLLLMGSSTPRLLDQYPASLAYSLRRLRNNYSGACLRLRRSSDSAEQDIGFAGTGLIDTAAAISFCGAGNGFVTTWYDQIGSNNASQSTAANQPQFVSSGAVIVNEFSKPAIQAVDSNAGAVGPRLAFLPWYVNTQSYVGIFASYSMAADGSFPYLLGSDAADRGLVILHNATARNIRPFAIRTSSYGGNGSAFATNTTTVLHVLANRTRVQSYVNTIVATDMDVADAAQNFNMPTSCWLFNNNTTSVTSNILCSEFIGYATDQTANQLLIRTNMSNYWRA